MVDKQGDNYSDTMVTKTKQARRNNTKCSAEGTGRARLKVLYQNGGNIIHTHEILEQIEGMLDSVRPHCFFMAENRMDTPTRDRLTNQHGFTVEEIGEGERIWAVKTTVPYKRRRDYEIKGVSAIWLEFGSGSNTYLVVGAYREFKRLGEENGRSREQQKLRWSRLMKQLNKVILDRQIECHLIGDLNLNTKRWPQLGSLKKGWEWTWFVNELYDKLINGAGMVLTETGRPTWTNKDGSRSSCIDIHLSNRPAKVKNVTVSQNFFKDHATLVLERADADVLGDATVTKRKWNEVDYVWMRCAFWEYWYWGTTRELCLLDDPDEICDRLTAILNVMLDSRWPVKTFKVKPSYAPYITRGMRDLRKVKQKLWKEWKITGNVETFQNLRRITNKLRNMTKKARKQWFGRKMSDYKDSEKLWKYAKIEANWKQDEIPSTIIKDGVKYTDPVDVANAIQDELMGKVKNILENIPDDRTDPLSYTRDWLAGKHVPALDLTRQADQEEVEAALATLNITDDPPDKEYERAAGLHHDSSGEQELRT